MFEFELFMFQQDFSKASNTLSGFVMNKLRKISVAENLDRSSFNGENQHKMDLGLYDGQLKNGKKLLIK